MSSDSMDYQGQPVKLNKSYGDYDDYKNDPNNLAVIHHGYTVCECDYLVELRGHDQHCRTSVALGNDPLVDELDCSHIMAPCGL